MAKNAKGGEKNAANNVKNTEKNAANNAQNAEKNAVNNAKNIEQNAVNNTKNIEKNAQNGAKNTEKSTQNGGLKGAEVPHSRLSLAQKGEAVLNFEGRVPIIDNAKGVMIVIMMLLGFGMMNMSAESFFSSHSVLPGIALRDLLTPALMFTVAMSLGGSFKRRAEKSGVKAAKKHVLARGFGYIAVGLLINEVMYLVMNIQYEGDYPRPSISWDILQAVGAALITASFAINLKNKHKIFFMLGLIAFPIVLTLIFPRAVNAYFYSSSVLSYGVEMKWGGVFSFFGFGAMLIAYDMLTRLAFKNIKKFIIVYALIVAAAVVCVLITPSREEVSNFAINGRTAANMVDYIVNYSVEYAVQFLKNPFIVNFMTLSVGYLLVGTAVGGGAVLIAVTLNYINDKDYFVFAAVGRNSLLMYLIFTLLSRAVTSFVNAQAQLNGTYFVVPWYVSLIVSIAATAVMCALAEFLDRKKIYFKI
ncbi:MAG: heparan-alpha-glucosaminide N-acetyltransferase domain-containing protein [Clostridiales bacterium]|jgi:hypothetical protein|nr:heparan-alpha-glucosaminide N-acetyltransferase domain-containing protein [Clostridiales bacterium]